MGLITKGYYGQTGSPTFKEKAAERGIKSVNIHEFARNRAGAQKKAEDRKKVEEARRKAGIKTVNVQHQGRIQARRNERLEKEASARSKARQKAIQKVDTQYIGGQVKRRNKPYARPSFGSSFADLARMLQSKK